MSGGEEKPGELQFIEIDDQFRRSRRNTLIACTVSILLSLSVIFEPANWSGGAAFPYFGAINIPRPFASSLAFIVAFYFFLGFREDAHATTIRNSKAIVSRGLEETAKMARQIESELKGWMSSRDRTLKWYEENFPKFEKFNSELVLQARGSFEAAKKQLGEIGAQNGKLRQLEQPTQDGKSIHFPDAGEILRIIEEIFMLSQNRTAVGAGFEDFYNRNLTNLADWQKKPDAAKNVEIDENLKEAVSALEGLNASLYTIDKSFGERGREFFEFYQVRFVKYYLVAVCVAFEVSLGFQIFAHYRAETLG